MNIRFSSSDAHAFRIALLLFGLSFATIPSYSQDAPSPKETGETLEITGVQPLVEESRSSRQIETVLAVNPTDPNNLIAAAMVHSDSNLGSVVYTSHDGGTSWQKATGPEGPTFPSIDPTVTFDGEGRAYFLTLAGTWRSDNGGETWEQVVSWKKRKKSYDRAWIAASHDTSGKSIPVYMAGMFRSSRKSPPVLTVSESRDRGQTFTRLTRHASQDTSFLHSVTDLVIRENGTILVPYLLHYPNTVGPEGFLEGKRFTFISTDGGTSWTGPHSVADNLTYSNKAGMELVAKGLGTGDFAVDETEGRFAESAYLTWTQIIDGHHQTVMARSRDGGRSWNDPVRVNSGGHDSHHSTPSVAVNKDGVVAVTWNDRRHDPEGQCYHHYVSISKDGGKTFTPGRRISKKETCFPSDYRWQNGGDTQGLVALPDGGFRTVFTGSGAENSRPWTAVIEVN